MKVAHLTSAHPPDDNRVFKMCRSAASAGHETTLVVPTAADSVVAGVAIKAVPGAKSRFGRIMTTWHVYRRALEANADVYEFHDPEMLPAGLALRLWHRRAVIYDVHENLRDQTLTRHYIPQPLRRWLAALLDVFERHGSRLLSAIVTANDDLNPRFGRQGQPVVTVHNYAEADEFAPPAMDEARYASGVIFHSAGDERTALPAVLLALDLLPAAVPRKLIVTQATASQYDHAVRLTHDRADVQLTGVLPRPEMARVLSQSALGMVLYADEYNHASIRSNRFYETLAAGAPMIVSDFPEWRAAVESIGCGLAVDPRDSAAIAAAIEHLVMHPAEAAAMGRRGREAFLRTFSWTTEKNKLLQLYDGLVPAPRGARRFASSIS